MGTTTLFSARQSIPSSAGKAPMQSSLLNEETVDPRKLRNALGRFATGVTVITTQTPSGKLEGLTANSFSALSLDPPLVLWSIRQSAPSLPGFLAASGFAVNVLAADQRKLAATFATASIDKFADVPFAIGLRGYPVLHRQHRRLRMPDGKHHRGRRPPDLHRPRRGDLVLRRRAAGLQPRRILRSRAPRSSDRASAAARLSRRDLRR